MLKGKRCETTISTPDKIIDKYHIIMDISHFSINLEIKILHRAQRSYFSLNNPVFG